MVCSVEVNFTLLNLIKIRKMRLLRSFKTTWVRMNSMVAVAQLVRAPGCGSGGRGFETHQPPH